MPFVDGIDASIMGPGDKNKFRINTVGLFVQAAEQIGVGSAIDDVPEGSVGQFDPDTQSSGRQPSLTTILDAWGNPIRAVHPAFDGVLTGGTLSNTYDPLNIEPVNLLESRPQPNLGLPDPVRLASDRPVSLISSVRRALFTDAIREEEDTRNTPSGRPFAREPGDSDGGISPNGRIYFYSPGANADPSDIESNIYTTEPRRPQID